MTDLIERLLAGPKPGLYSGEIMEEAADEILRLREELSRNTCQLEPVSNSADKALTALREALKEEK